LSNYLELLPSPCYHSVEYMPTLAKVVRQAYDIQDFTYQCIMALQKEMGLKAPDKDQTSAIINLARTWSEAAERVRIGLGKPLPGSYKPVKSPKQIRNPFDTLSSSAADNVVQMPQDSPKTVGPTQPVVVPEDNKEAKS
jgi:hypothetical protein